MKKRIILHIGYNKSGSTTIQKWFYLNADLLLSEMGILYPKAGRYEFTHHNFGWASIGERNLNFREILEELDDEVSSTDCEACVVSTEALSLQPYISAPNVCSEFRRKGMDSKYNVTIFGIIRQQANWLQSEYNQQIEATELISSFADFMKLDWPNLNYHDVFTQYRTQMPQSHIQVAWFEDLISNGSRGLIRSVFNALGGGFECDFSRFSEPQKENYSLTMYISELKRRLNEINETELGNKICSDFQYYAEKGRAPRWISKKGEVKFLSRFREQNLRVSEAFSTGIESRVQPWRPVCLPPDKVPVIKDPVSEAYRFLDELGESIERENDFISSTGI